MSALEALSSSFLFVVAIAANVLNIDSPEDSVIDDIILDGNESLFSAFIIMKNNKESEEIILDSNEVEDIEPVLPHDNKNDKDITENGEIIDSPDELLRKKPWKSCMTKASKICTKSCKTAVKDGCDYRDCKKKLKTALKKECKRSCKVNFIGS